MKNNTLAFAPKNIRDQLLHPFTVHKIGVRVRRALEHGEIAVHNTNVKVCETTADHLVLELTGHLLGSANIPFVLKHPNTWWEHFKERWYPHWAKKKWPVKYNQITIDNQVCYTKLQAVILPHEEYIHIRRPTSKIVSG